MGDRILAGGVDTIGTFTPIQLYAGERPVVTTQGTLLSGQKVGQLNARNETFKFPVVAEVAGKLVKWNQAGNDGSQIIAGVLPHALDASATGYNADVDTPIIKDAVLNWEAMDIGAVTYAQLRAAACDADCNITFQKLY
jgi:hypothetical protein